MTDKDLEIPTPTPVEKPADEPAGEPPVIILPAKEWSPIIWAGDWLERIGVYLGQDAMPRMAAALAYRTVFSLVPLLLCGFLVLRIFQEKSDPDVKPEDTLVGRFLKNLLDLTGLSGIMTQEGSVQGWVTNLVEKFNGINFGAVGIVSAVVLIYAALSLMVDIESSFNQVYGAHRGRSWVRRIMQYWLMISLGPLLLIAGFSAGEALRSNAQEMLGTAGGDMVGPSLVTAASYAVTVATSAILLMILYITIPNTVVRFRSAAMGALLAACLLEAAKYGFQTFLRGEGYKSLYGALALLPLFLLWVYITWFIVLFGLRVAFLIQHGRTGVLLNAFRLNTQTRLGGSWMEPARAVATVLGVADLFAQGRTAHVARLAEQAAMDEPTTRLLLHRLEDAGILNRVTTAGREETYALARPPDAIPVAEIVAVGQSLAGPVSPGPAGDLLARVRNAQLQAVAGVTLGSLMSKKTARAVSSVSTNGAANAPSVAPAPAAPVARAT